VARVALVDSDLVLRALLNVVTMVLSVCVHEFAHAFAAYRLGDDTAARDGRLTLNPLAHADPIGTVLLPGLAPFMGFGAFGWGKPVPYVPTNLTRKYSMRAGEAIIAFAGPFANLVMGILSAGLLIGLTSFQVIGLESPIAVLLQAMVYINFILLFFNLLPVPPLDGSKVAAWLFGRKADPALDTIQGAGMLGLFLAIAVGGFVAVPLARVLQSWTYRGFLAVLA
jgi:Zn-dependent protease